jgi:uncharacterized protein YodC (DUF2158 family)
MSHRAMFSILMLSAGARLLSAQAIVELGALTGRGGAANGGAAAGKSVVDIFGKVSQTLGGAATVGEGAKPRAVPATTAKTQPTPAPLAPIAPADLSALVTGMDRADLLKKVGKPAMSISSVEDSTMVETCWFRSSGEQVTVILRDGKVASISGMEKKVEAAQ